jgi:hypothetical protein
MCCMYCVYLRWRLRPGGVRGGLVRLRGLLVVPAIIRVHPARAIVSARFGVRVRKPGKVAVLTAEIQHPSGRARPAAGPAPVPGWHNCRIHQRIAAFGPGVAETRNVT